MLALAEAAWASLLLGVLYNGPHRPHVDLPLPALALPAVAGTLLAGSRGRWGPRVRPPAWVRWPARWRLEVAVLGVVAVAGAALTAGLVSELSVPGSLWRVATQPWSSVGHRAAVVAGASWLVAVATWARGTWLGTATLSLSDAAWSMVAAAAVYLGVFVGRGADHSPAFRAASSGAGELFFVTFPLAAAVTALVHQRDLERQVLTRASSRPSATWVAVLVAPMAGMAAVALLLAVAVGPAAPTLGRAFAAAGTAAWSALSAAGVFLWHLLPRGHARGKLPTLPGSRRPVHPGHRGHPEPARRVRITVPAVVTDVVGGAALLGAAVYVLRNVRFTRRRAPRAADAAEDQESLFTWRHLLDQLRAALVALWRRLLGSFSRLGRHPERAAPPGVAGTGAAGGTPAPPPGSVREAYRRLLVAARLAGSGRRAAETPAELAQRFAGPLGARDPSVADRLLELTGLYEADRYGAGGSGEAQLARALAHAEAVVPVLRAALGPEAPGEGRPAPGPLTAPGRPPAP